MVVKTAISLPDDTFDAASRRAKQLGISRSEFFATAARRYLDHLERQTLTAHVDAVLASAGDDDSAADAVAVGHARLVSDADW